MKQQICIFLYFLLVLNGSFADSPIQEKCFSTHYAQVIEKLIFYKENLFTLFYGGPIAHKSGCLRWLMLATFEDEHYQTKAYYEIAFINCTYTDAQDAELLYVEIPDINIKFKNQLVKDYKVFSDLCDGKYSQGKYIIIRAADIGIPFYPNIYIDSLRETEKKCARSRDEEKNVIANILSTRFHTKKNVLNYYVSSLDDEIVMKTPDEICYKPIPLQVQIDEVKCNFLLEKKILLNDQWKVYYLISSASSENQVRSSEHKYQMAPFLRLDSGCLAGQIYGDDACDCLDQLHSSLKHLVFKDSNGLVIHIPTHDGRGFGSAPKAETEIYKVGGRGRVNRTDALDTIAAAKYLYRCECIDLRTFDGVAHILKKLDRNKVSIYTDNRTKVDSLHQNGIETLRIPTETCKESCLQHLKAKKNHSSYFGQDERL